MPRWLIKIKVGPRKNKYDTYVETWTKSTTNSWNGIKYYDEYLNLKVGFFLVSVLIVRLSYIQYFVQWPSIPNTYSEVKLFVVLFCSIYQFCFTFFPKSTFYLDHVGFHSQQLKSMNSSSPQLWYYYSGDNHRSKTIQNGITPPISEILPIDNQIVCCIDTYIIPFRASVAVKLKKGHWVSSLNAMIIKENIFSYINLFNYFLNSFHTTVNYYLNSKRF